MTCEKVKTPEGYAFVCGRPGGRTQLVCDVCDRAVKKHGSTWPWRNITIELCERCKLRRDTSPEFVSWSDPVIASHYPDGNDAP